MTDTNTPPAASERRGPFEVDTRPERIFEIRALAEVRAFGNGSGADMALRDLLALVDKQAKELAGREHEVIELSEHIGLTYHKAGVALSPQPDRAKASPDVEDVVQRLIVASGIGKASADNENYVANASIKDCDDAIATIRTITARAEAAEARAEGARADGFRDGLEWARQLAGTWAVQYLLDEEPSQEKSDLLNEVVEAIEKQMPHPRPAPMADGER